MKEAITETENAWIWQGETFIRNWYEQIDGKRDFEMVAAMTAGMDLVVDFPNNPLDFYGFQQWYEQQCRVFTGRHLIHSIRVAEEEGLMVIFSEITWEARNLDGETIRQYPNVTMKLRSREEGLKVLYYGCRDRE